MECAPRRRRAATELSPALRRPLESGPLVTPAPSRPASSCPTASSPRASRSATAPRPGSGRAPTATSTRCRCDRARVGDQPGARHPVGGHEVRPARTLYVAGGTSGTARVVDTDTGDVLADVPLTTGRPSSTTWCSPGAPPGSPTPRNRSSTACAARRRRTDRDHGAADRRVGAGRRLRRQRHQHHPDRTSPAGGQLHHRPALPRRPRHRRGHRGRPRRRSLTMGDGMLRRGPHPLRRTQPGQRDRRAPAVPQRAPRSARAHHHRRRPRPVDELRRADHGRALRVATSTCPTRGSPPRPPRPPTTG